MNDVKELCELALEVPAPPLPSAGSVVALARRETRRRRLLAMSGSALALVAVAAVALFAAVDRQAPPVTAGPSLGVTAGAPETVLPAAPGPDVAHNHSHRIAELLLEAIPHRYLSTVDFISIGAPASTWRINSTDYYVSTTRIVVTDHENYGALSAVFVVKGAPPPAGLCDAAMSTWLAQMLGPANDDCQVLVVNGVTVRVAAGIDPHQGRFHIALRLLDQGIVAVVAQQGIRPFWPLSPATPFPLPSPSVSDKTWLPEPPLTGLQAAALVANPALLPG